MPARRTAIPSSAHGAGDTAGIQRLQAYLLAEGTTDPGDADTLDANVRAAILTRAILAAYAGESSISPRQRVHSWLGRYAETGLTGLEDRSYRPVSCPRQAPPEALGAAGAGHGIQHGRITW